MSSDYQRLSPLYDSRRSATVQRLIPGVSQEREQPFFSARLGRDGSTVLTLGDQERRSGLYILGRPGMGKSTLLVNLALQDMEHGQGVFFLDPHTDAIRDLLKRLPPERKDDVLYFTITDKTHSFGINPVACADPSDIGVSRDTYTKAYEVFHTLWQREWGPWLQLIVANLIRALIENQDYTLAAAPDFLTDADFRKQLVANIRFNMRVKAFWNERFAAKRSVEQEREVDAALTRVEMLLTDLDVAHVIGQRKTTLDFSRLMKERKIVLVSFPANLPDDTKRFLGTILVRELLWAARARRGGRSQFCVFVDEFQNFVTPDFASLIRETRKFGIALTIAQQFSLGPEYQWVNEAVDAMANKVIFQPTVKDAERTAKEFADRPEPEWLEVLSEEERIPVADEWLQRIEEVVENGVEPIPTLAQQPLTYLLRGHSDPEVNRLTARVLQPLANALQIAQAETEQAGVTEKASHEPVFHHQPDGEFGIAFVAKREQLLTGKQEIDRLLFDLMQKTIEYGSREAAERLQAIVAVLRAFIGFSQGAVWQVRRELISVREPLGYYRNVHGYRPPPTPEQLERRYAYAGDWIDVPLDPQIEQLLPEIVSVVVREVPDALQDEHSLMSLALLSETQGSFEQVRLFRLWQASQEEWRKRMEADLAVNEETFKEAVRKEVRQQWSEQLSKLRPEYDQLKQSYRQAEEKEARWRAVLMYDNLKAYRDREYQTSRRAQIERLLRTAEEELSEELTLYRSRRELLSQVGSADNERLRRGDPLMKRKMEIARLESDREVDEEVKKRLERNRMIIAERLIPETIEKLRENDLPQELSEYARNIWLASQRQALAELTPIARAEYRRLAAFLTDLCKICVALSVPEQHIIIPSNQYRPRKETKITYVMHPEKAYTKAARTLTHPHRPHTDLVAEAERNLLDLAPYTAAYKLLPAGGGAPRKGVLATFELGKEHDPSLAREFYRSIIARSHAPEYSQPREEVEKEIQQQQQPQRQARSDDTAPTRRDRS